MSSKKHPRLKFKCPLQIKCRPCAHSENITTSINTSSNTPSDEPSVSTNLGPVALDCEMVGVGIKKVDALGRVSIVDYEGQLLYDAIVHPEEEITDYRTPWSGIRQEDMSRAIEYSCAREHVQSIIQNRILVGHSLNRDLHVLNLEHPSHLVRDIAKVQYPKLLAGFLVKNPIGLRALTIRLFGVNIQDGEHCSIEDACASMAIYRLVEEVWQRDLVKGMKKTRRRQSGTHSHTDNNHRDMSVESSETK